MVMVPPVQSPGSADLDLGDESAQGKQIALPAPVPAPLLKQIASPAPAPAPLLAHDHVLETTLITKHQASLQPPPTTTPKPSPMAMVPPVQSPGSADLDLGAASARVQQNARKSPSKAMSRKKPMATTRLTSEANGIPVADVTAFAAAPEWQPEPVLEHKFTRQPKKVTSGMQSQNRLPPNPQLSAQQLNAVQEQQSIRIKNSTCLCTAWLVLMVLVGVMLLPLTKNMQNIKPVPVSIPLPLKPSMNMPSADPAQVMTKLAAAPMSKAVSVNSGLLLVAQAEATASTPSLKPTMNMPFSNPAPVMTMLAAALMSTTVPANPGLLSPLDAPPAVAVMPTPVPLPAKPTMPMLSANVAHPPEVASSSIMTTIIATSPQPTTFPTNKQLLSPSVVPADSLVHAPTPFPAKPPVSMPSANLAQQPAAKPFVMTTFTNLSQPVTVPVNLRLVLPSPQPVACFDCAGV
jgi:hypothetical protein